MKKVFVSLVFMVLVTFLFSVPLAGAQTSNYAVLKAGAYFPNTGDLNGFNTGFNGEAAFGHYFNKYLAAELGVGYFQASGSGSNSGTTANADIYAIPLTLAVKAIYPIDRFEIYGIGGMGAYFCNIKGHETGSTSESSTATSFGGFVGAGANFNIDQHWFVGVEGKYLWTTPGFSSGGETANVKFDGCIVTGNVGFRF